MVSMYSLPPGSAWFSRVLQAYNDILFIIERNELISKYCNVQFMFSNRLMELSSLEWCSFKPRGMFSSVRHTTICFLKFTEIYCKNTRNFTALYHSITTNVHNGFPIVYFAWNQNANIIWPVNLVVGSFCPYRTREWRGRLLRSWNKLLSPYIVATFVLCLYGISILKSQTFFVLINLFISHRIKVFERNIVNQHAIIFLTKFNYS